MIRRRSASLEIGLGLLLAVVSALAGVGLSAADAAVPTSMALPAPSAGPRLAAPIGNSPGTANADLGQDIRDIHGPITIPGRRSPWWYVCGAAIAVGVLATLVLYSRRKRIAPPHERALRALEEAGTMFEAIRDSSRSQSPRSSATTSRRRSRCVPPIARPRSSWLT